MHRGLLAVIPALLLATTPAQAEVTAPASERFAGSGVTETASFRRHVVPLMGRLGCNGRACHGSFQGQGGFRLSLFGYDFPSDHQALTAGESPRVDQADPPESLILKKPTLALAHKGGKRLQAGTWEYRLLENWIRQGATNDSQATGRLRGLSASPAQFVFHKPGDHVQLRVIAHWSDGTEEDVTDLSRFRTNDEAVATVDVSGRVTSTGKGDTDVVAFYDNGVTPVQVMLPVSDRVGDRYPEVPAPTRIDELVIAKLRHCGITPSDLSTDTEFLRRASLDVTGTLPTPAEIESFLADASPHKRSRKIDELLARPAYAAWWATKLCDLTGNNGQYADRTFSADYTRQWYEWIYRRVRENVGYDQLVAGLVLGTSRKPGQSFEDFSREMSTYYRKDQPADFSERPTLPHFWARRTVQRPEDKALGFSYAFLGVRLQCAVPQAPFRPMDETGLGAVYRPLYADCLRDSTRGPPSVCEDAVGADLGSDAERQKEPDRAGKYRARGKNDPVA